MHLPGIGNLCAITGRVNCRIAEIAGFKNRCRARAGFRSVMLGSGRVRASKWGPFAALVVHIKLKSKSSYVRCFEVVLTRQQNPRQQSG